MPIGNWVYNALSRELMKCDATGSQQEELWRIYRGEMNIYQELGCSMTYAGAEEKARAIIKALEQRDRSVSTWCRR